MKAAVIISESAFETVEGQSAIFHEFVHCFQWDEGERELKQTLTIAREGMGETGLYVGTQSSFSLWE
jgi:hypothetical protein